MEIPIHEIPEDLPPLVKMAMNCALGAICEGIDTEKELADILASFAQRMILRTEAALLSEKNSRN